ncbi:hypothetical protein R3P38DRAFT_3113705 [Favolaschia claudopus]|uniref:Uncharacterized protein n=1 Tax=Favolaschia claudopus TaxID=2862362 RepID=A0AAV9ZHL5_9AGAR
MHDTRYVLYSGYWITADYFVDLVNVLHPKRSEPEVVPDGFEPPKPFFGKYLVQYDNWRRALSKEDRVNSPLVKAIRSEECERNYTGDETETKLFFPIRWVDIREDMDLELQLQSPALSKPNESDEAKRDQFIDLVKRTSGFVLDKKRMKFECIKDTDPFL